MIDAVTIDFHDTLFQCDDWFELEVRQLPARFLEWLAETHPELSHNSADVDINALYRTLRVGAIESGIEIDSLDCVDRICTSIGLAVDREIIESGVDTLMRRMLPSAEPRPGAVELVRTLHNAGLKLGVISNAIHHDFLEWALDRCGLREDFDIVLSSAKAGFYKSRVDLYHRAACELGVSARSVTHVGDSYRFDVVGASAAGMRTVWLNLRSDAPGEVEPDLTVSTLVGLGERLLEQRRGAPQPRQGSIGAV